MAISNVCTLSSVEAFSSRVSLEENFCVDTNISQQKRNVKVIRPIVKKFLQSKEREEISALLPSFTTVLLFGKYSRLSTAKVIETYQLINTIARRVFTALSQEETKFYKEGSISALVEKSSLFLQLLQSATLHALGSLLEGEKLRKTSLVERGFLLKKLLSSDIACPFPTALLLSEKNLICVPKEIEKCSSVKVLDLSKNGLFALPPEMAQLQGLIQLNLSSNNLRDLPKEMDQLTSLEIVDFSNNPLETFPEFLNNMSSLKAIRFDKEQCKKFSDEIKIFLKKNKNCQIEVQRKNGICKLWPC